MHTTAVPSRSMAALSTSALALVVACAGCGDPAKPSGPVTQVTTVTAVPTTTASAKPSAAAAPSPKTSGSAAAPAPIPSGSAAAAPSLGAGAYKSASGAFAADLACKPSVTDDENEHTVACASDPYRTVRWHDEPKAPDAKKIFDETRDAFAKTLEHPKVVAESDVDAGGHPAHDVTFEVTKDQRPGVMLLRILLVGQRVYAISTRDEDPSERARFVSTFTLTK